MNKTTNLELTLYEKADTFAITASQNSLNHNMEIIDEAITNKPGIKADGGEIFNAEYDNIAGGKCFSIVELIPSGSSTVVDLNTITITDEVSLDIENDKILDAQVGGRVGTCPWELFSFEVPAGNYIVNNLNPVYQDYGFYMGINSTQNSELLFIDNEAFSFTAPDSTNTIHIFYGVREYFGDIYDFDDNGSFRPFGAIINFSVSKTILAAYKLDDIEGIEIGDIYSLKIGANYDFYGKVTHLDTNNNIVTVSSFTKGTTTDLSDAVMWFPYKPQIGTQVNGGAEHAEGYATTALNWAGHSEGFYTLAEGKYSHAQNYNTIAGYACHAEGQNTRALGEWSHAQGMATSALNRYTFSFGNSTVSMENYFDKKVLTTLTNEEIEKAWKNADPKFTCANGSASTAGGNNTLALGSVSTALGKETIAKGNNSLSTGYLTSAEGENSASFGKNTHAIGDNSIAIGDNNTAYGKNSITFGSNNNITEWNLYEDEAYPYDDSPNNCIDNLQIEGSNNIIKKSLSYLWDGKTIIKNSHIEGANNQFDVHLDSKMLGSHIEGINNKIGSTILNGSHVEGLNNDIEYPLQSGGNIEASHIEGYNNKIKSIAIQSHIEGAANTISTADYNKDQVCIHVEGYNNKIFNSNYSHTQGTTNTVTNSPSSHVGGWNNKITNGNGAFAHGHGLIAKGTCSIAVGKWNVESDANSKSLDTAQFTVGIGTDTNNRKNAFCVLRNGNVTAAGAYQTSGADYSELFEWIDGNINNEDRRGYFVTLDGDKIRIANSEDDYILGIVSATPSVLGDSYFGSNWHGKYLTDIFGTIITETIHVEEKPICIKEEYIDKRVLEDGTVKEYIEPAQYEIIPAHDETIPVINPDYDPEREYIDRLNRQEWTPIGMMGKLVVIDDGTCKVNGYCKVSSNGIATNSENGYRVMSRLDDTHIRILFK